jgi:hypothetical protein
MNKKIVLVLDVEVVDDNFDIQDMTDSFKQVLDHVEETFIREFTLYEQENETFDELLKIISYEERNK